MKSFKTAFQKATGRRNLDKPKEKHLRTINNTFSEVPFDKASELFTKQLNEKNTVPRIRALIVIHFLIQNSNQAVQSWFANLNILIESNKPCQYIQLFITYYNYLKAKTRSGPTLALSFNQSTLQTLRANPVELLQKTEEMLNLLQSLVNVKKPLKQFNENKEKMNFVCEITTRVLIDSKDTYLGLKSFMNTLWSNYSSFEVFHASQAEGMFLRYNKAVKGLKGFIRVWTEEYPGQIPTFNLLSAESLKEVQKVVRAKESINTKVNLLEFQEINQNGSPKKDKENLQVSHQKKNSGPESFYSFPIAPLAPMGQMPIMNGNQFYYVYPQNPMYFCPFVPK